MRMFSVYSPGILAIVKHLLLRGCANWYAEIDNRITMKKDIGDKWTIECLVKFRWKAASNVSHHEFIVAFAAK
jgi:hypothetical protein